MAEDLAQDAFIQAWKKSGSYNATGSFDAWLRQITVNTALQYIRKKQNTLVYDEIEAIEKSTFAMERIDKKQHDVKALNFTPSELFEIISALPEHHRTVFNLYVIDQYTHAQIAEELDISVGTSKSHLARARKKLQHLVLLQTEEKKRKEDWKEALLLLIFPKKATNIDQLFQENFNQYKLKPSSSLIKSISSKTQLHFAAYATKSIIILSSITIITLGTIFLIPNHSQTAATEETNIPELPQTKQIDKETFSQDSIIKIKTEIQKDTNTKDKPPVVIKKQRIKRNPVVVKKSVVIIDSSHAE